MSELVCLVESWICPECNFENLSFVLPGDFLICEKCTEEFICEVKGTA
jgi:hypothetical protein